MLDYLRNGGALPPLPKEDEQLLQRIREEFDYFCFTPNPVDDSRSWVEKFRDGDYTADVLKVKIPRGYETLVTRMYVTDSVCTEKSDYLAVCGFVEEILLQPNHTYSTTSTSTRILWE